MAVSPSLQGSSPHPEDDGPAILDPDEVDEEILGDGEDAGMDSGDGDGDGDGDEDGGDDEPMEVDLINDSSVYFDQHTDSIYCLSQHRHFPCKVILTGGGDDVAYIWEVPSASEVRPAEAKVLQKLGGHTDSIVAGGWTHDGNTLITAGLDGRVRSWRQKLPGRTGVKVNGWEWASEVQEVEEVQWVDFHPGENVFALGAGDGSVWVYEVEGSGELVLRHAMYNHTGSCTAGQWTPDGGLLVTVSEDGSLYAWDVNEGGRAVVSLTGDDQRWFVDGGWVSVAVNWDSSAAVAGSAGGVCKVVGLPRTTTATTTNIIPAPSRGRGGRGAGTAGGSQAGQILATMATHTQSVESLSFSRSLPLLASSSVDGSIVIYDTSRAYSVRRTIPHAHPNPRFSPSQQPPTSTSTSTSTPAEPIEDNGENTVVKVEFINSTHPPTGIILTSCGVDGTVKRWDGRSGAELGCWRGHADGVLGFVQAERRIVTAGDDHVALVFDVQPQATAAVMAPGQGR